MSTGGSSTVLIVDDEREICELLSFQLARDGYKVLVASSGQEALQIVRNSEIDLVVSDIRMAGGDGPFLLKAMREEGLGNPLIFMSGFSDFDESEARRRGALGLIQKPFDMGCFRECVQNALAEAQKTA